MSYLVVLFVCYLEFVIWNFPEGANPLSGFRFRHCSAYLGYILYLSQYPLGGFRFRQHPKLGLSQCGFPDPIYRMSTFCLPGGCTNNRTPTQKPHPNRLEGVIAGFLTIFAGKSLLSTIFTFCC